MKKRDVLPGLVAAVAMLSAGCLDPFSYGTRAGGGSVPDNVTYEGDVYPLLLSSCSACHESAGTARGTSFVLSSDAAADYAMITSFVTPGDPGDSILLQKASGASSHRGSGLWAESSVEYLTIAAWIEQGAEQQ